eukprot:gene23044-30238_t
MADELAPPSKLVCFFRTLLCTRGPITCTSDQDSDFPFSRNSIALSSAATKAVAVRSQKSVPTWSNIVVNQTYTADKGTGNECPSSLSPRAIFGEVDDLYLYFPTSASNAPPLLLPTIEDRSPDPEQDLLWPSNNVSSFLAGGPSPKGGVRTSWMHNMSSVSLSEQFDGPNSLEILGANQQDKALGGVDCQLIMVSPVVLPPVRGRQNTQASTLNASKQSPHVKGLLVDQGVRTLSGGRQVVRGYGLDVQNLSSVLSQDSSPKYRRKSACHSMVQQGRPELGQGVGIRSYNSVTVGSRSGPIFNRLSVCAVDTSMRSGVDTSMRRDGFLSSPGAGPPPQPWQRKSTLIPRLQNGRVGRYLELLKQNSAAAAVVVVVVVVVVVLLPHLHASNHASPSNPSRHHDLAKPSCTQIALLSHHLAIKGVPASTPSNVNTILPQHRPVSAPLNKIKSSVLNYDHLGRIPSIQNDSA